MRDRERERDRDIGRGRSRFHAGSPKQLLNPRTPGSRPEPKADAQPLSHPGAPPINKLKKKKTSIKQNKMKNQNKTPKPSYGQSVNSA